MKITKFLSLLAAMILLVSMFAGCSGNNTADPNLSYEEGTSSADDIVNTTPADKVLLVVSFGTSFNQSRNLTIGGIEAALKQAYPDYQIRRAFTSQIIIDKLAERDNLKIDNVEDAMNRLVLDNVKEVVIQPTTIMTGYEYDDVIDEVMPFADKFESFKIGKPLLTDDADYDAVAEVVVQETINHRADGTAIVFMGHGTEHAANATYDKFQAVVTSKGYHDYIIGTVEAEPTLEDVQASLRNMNAKKVILRPLMIVAGDHANNDMAGGEEDSWKTILTKDGYKVKTVIEGLGQIKGIQDIFVEHVQDAINSESVKGITATAAAGVTAARIKNGTYSIEVDSSSAMFKIVECKLTVKDGAMQAVMTLSGQGFSKVYMGAAADSQNDVAGQKDFALAGERHSFTVPVAALDRELPCAALGVKSGSWFDHTLIFKSDQLTADDFATCEIDVALIGGSGKVTVESPAKLTYKNGEDAAVITWSSSKYTYMLVDGVKYLPVNTEGNSAFEIPVKFDTEMNVIACTVAMSEPKEIEYVLHFDSTSIK